MSRKFRKYPAAWIVLLSLGCPVAGSADANETMESCAQISTPSDRLACYDRVAGKRAAPEAHARDAEKAATRGTVSREKTQPASSPGSAPADPALPKETFGLYSSEHPTAPKGYPGITAAVTGITAEPGGTTLLALEGGQLWRIVGGDPLLATGDSVSIARGTFGSFILSTPSGRQHRVHRVR